jgi:hypothetical protein
MTRKLPIIKKTLFITSTPGLMTPTALDWYKNNVESRIYVNFGYTEQPNTFRVHDAARSSILSFHTACGETGPS